MLGPLLFGVLLAGCVLLFFLAMRGMMGSRNNAVDARLEEYGISIEPEAEAQPKGKRRRSWPLVNQLINGFGMGPALARDLERAGMPMTAAEYAMICIVLGTAAFLIGAWRGGSLARTPWAARRAGGRRPGRLCAGHLPALPGGAPCQAAGRSAPRRALPAGGRIAGRLWVAAGAGDAGGAGAAARLSGVRPRHARHQPGDAGAAGDGADGRADGQRRSRSAGDRDRGAVRAGRQPGADPGHHQRNAARPHQDQAGNHRP